MRLFMRWLGLFLVCLLNGSCAFHKTADQWNGLVGPTGDPVHLNATTKVGFNFLVFFPFIGKMGIAGMVEEATDEIREDGGNYVRVVQSTSENYWYALPPITWVVTPVVHSLVVEYRPRAGSDWFQPSAATRPPPDPYPPQTYDWRGTRH